MPARTRADPVPEGCLPAGKPSLPLWCAMVTRTISLRSEEGQEPGAKEAVAKEVASHTKHGTWDLLRVRELSEWMRDDACSEVLVGRVFVTLGVKFAEMAKSEWKFRARAENQGNNIWSKSGRTVPDDAALVRLMAYLKAEASLELVGTLLPDDVTGLQLELSTDADWNGDACTTRSVSGMHLALVNPKSGKMFPLAWRSSANRQLRAARPRARWSPSATD